MNTEKTEMRENKHKQEQKHKKRTTNMHIIIIVKKVQICTIILTAKSILILILCSGS